MPRQKYAGKNLAKEKSQSKVFLQLCVVSFVYCIAAIGSSINKIDGVLFNVLHGQWWILMVHTVMKRTLYNKTQMVLEQCKLRMEFKSNIDLNNAR